ncbi:MAG TPA: hypothetical protein VFW19_01010 [Allosphingosinicella sp.]|nr:hypothetical protein [Allosphingosinicella sp.]
MTLLQFLSAFSLGAIVTAFVQAWLAHRSYLRQRAFSEKKESYIGFLDALHRSEVEQTEAASLNVGHWQSRIEVVGSSEVIAACLRIRETNPTPAGIHPERPHALQSLKKAMRIDLGVAERSWLA